MKRKFFLAIAVFIFATSLYAVDIVHHADATVGLVTQSAMAPDHVHIQVGYGLDLNDFSGEAKFQVASETISLGLDASYKFLDTKHCILTGRGFFCMELMMNEAFATDTFIGATVSFPTRKIFCASIETLCGLKTSNIFALGNTPALCNFDFAVSVKFTWDLWNTTQFFTSFSSYEFFYHPKFFAPIFATGATYKFNDQFTGTAEFSMRTIDLLILSSYVEGFALRLKVEYKFK